MRKTSKFIAVALIICITLLTVIGCANQNPSHQKDSTTYYRSTPTVYAYELDISTPKITNNSVFTEASGTIKNNGSATVYSVKIKGAFKTKSGTTVDTDWTYAVTSEGLKPGETKKWRLTVNRDTSIDSCSVSILDFDTK